MAQTNGAASFEQPSSFAFDDASEAEIAKIVARYPAGRQASAVLPALYIAQKQMQRQTGSAWVPLKAMDAVGARLGMAPIRDINASSISWLANKLIFGLSPRLSL